MCERRYRVGERWYNLRPDGLAEYRVGSRHIRFWLEWDRGTRNVHDLAIKFTSYAHFKPSRVWAREDASVPWLLCVAPEIAQEKRIHHVTQARLAHTSGLFLCTTTKVLLKEYSPLAPIWFPGTPVSFGQGGQPDSLHRYNWSQLMSQSDAN
jgi:hypothetical protein